MQFKIGQTSVETQALKTPAFWWLLEALVDSVLGVLSMRVSKRVLEFSSTLNCGNHLPVGAHAKKRSHVWVCVSAPLSPGIKEHRLFIAGDGGNRILCIVESALFSSKLFQFEFLALTSFSEHPDLSKFAGSFQDALKTNTTHQG